MEITSTILNQTQLELGNDPHSRFCLLEVMKAKRSFDQQNVWPQNSFYSQFASDLTQAALWYQAGYLTICRLCRSIGMPQMVQFGDVIIVHELRLYHHDWQETLWQHLWTYSFMSRTGKCVTCLFDAEIWDQKTRRTDGWSAPFCWRVWGVGQMLVF